MRASGRKLVFEDGNPQNMSIGQKARKCGYDLNNPITAAVLSGGHRTGPDHTAGRVMSVYRLFPARHRKPGAA